MSKECILPNCYPVSLENFQNSQTTTPRLIGGCAGTQYGCDASGNAAGPPTEKPPLKGGCAGTQYGCDSSGNPRGPTTPLVITESPGVQESIGFNYLTSTNIAIVVIILIVIIKCSSQ